MQTADICERKVQFLSNITPKILCRVSFDTEKLNRKHREVFALLSFVPGKEEFSLSGFSFSLFVNIHDLPEAKHDCKSFRATAESPDAKETYSWLSSA